MKVAVIGIGSNSVRMLVAEVDGAAGVRLAREREGTRLFAGLDEKTRCLHGEAMAKTVAAVAKMAAQARGMGAEEISLFATSATRDAGNADELAQRLRDEAGLELNVCSGEDEAALSFLGATDGQRCGVIDIGGGSTELVIGQGDRLETAFSCQMGAVRLWRLLSIRRAEDIPPVVEAAKQILREKLAESPHAELPHSWIGTGGTFTALGALLRGTPWTDRTYMHGTRLPFAWIQAEACKLANMTPEERLALPSLQPSRADIVVHGISILLAGMEVLGLSEITVSEFGNLDGYLKRKYSLTSLKNKATC